MTQHGDLRGVSGGGKYPTEYLAWKNIKQRCFNPNWPQWRDYGGRGITMCDRWRNSYIAFLTDMGRKPTPQHTIERVNNDGNYEPGNCCWATRNAQMLNKRPQQSERRVAPHWIRRNTKAEGEYYVLVIPRLLPLDWQVEGGQ